MHSKLVKNISWNTLQVLGNQVLGVFIFLLISRYLDKPVFGELSWSLALLTFITTILSLRLEQIIVRNIAAGDNASKMLTLFTAHNLVTGLSFFAVLSAGIYFFPAFFSRHSLLWILAIGQLLSFFSLPFRQLATGRSAFGWLALLSSISNLIRAGWFFWLVIFSGLTLRWVLIVFTVSAGIEFIAGIYIGYRWLKTPLSLKGRFPDYKVLIKDSLPQLGMVFLNALIARADWILLGIFSTQVHTAEYSFAYRAYEFSPLPLLILAPILLNRFAQVKPLADRKLDRFVRMEMILATLLPLLLVIAWSPLVDRLTDHKYGQVNAITFLTLSACIPFQYLINLYWTAEFARNRLGLIFKVTALTGLIVLAGDCLLIPRYAGPGAALAYLIAMIVQYLLYYRVSVLEGRGRWNRQLLQGIAIAACSGLSVYWLSANLPLLWGRLLPLRWEMTLLLQLVIAGGLYGVGAWAAGLIGRKDMRAGRGWVERSPAWTRLRDWMAGVDWPLLLFLVLFLNVKLYVKVVAVLLAFCLHRRLPGFRELFQKKWLGFYGSMLFLAGIHLLLSFSSLTTPALLSFALGFGYWLLAMSAAWLILLFVERQKDKERLHRTATLFFLLNVISIGIVFAGICWKAGTINPYTYEGEHRKYFISTGDSINGISFDGSVTAALISAFGVLYFLYRDKKGYSLLCLITVLLAGSNFIDIMLIGVLLFTFFFHSNRVQKSMVVAYLLVMTVFWAKVSPQNKDYTAQLLSRIDGKNRYDTPLPLPHPRITDFVEKTVVVERKQQLASFMDTLYPPARKDSLTAKYKGWDRSGRWIAWQELADLYRNHPGRLLLGSGMGNFSSRLAFKTAAVNIEGTYPPGERYIDPSFRDNYLYLYLYYHTRDEGQHSVINKPDSVYGQLLGEYGLIGLGCFFLLYAGFFLQRVRSLSYGLPLLLLLGASFLTEYWFEQLSVVVLFEFLMLLDRKNYAT
ncbi:MAG TPA: oligosaccharide flippase family protein [Puia sp.]|nr:oligosaccharide flippase family protein [Puia sp.]